MSDIKNKNDYEIKNNNQALTNRKGSLDEVSNLNRKEDHNNKASSENTNNSAVDKFEPAYLDVSLGEYIYIGPDWKVCVAEATREYATIYFSLASYNLPHKQTKRWPNDSFYIVEDVQIRVLKQVGNLVSLCIVSEKYKESNCERLKNYYKTKNLVGTQNNKLNKGNNND